MRVLSLIVAIMALVIGVLGTLSLLTLLMAGGANSTDAQIRAIKMWMLVTAIGGLLTFVGGVWLTAIGKHWIGAGVGILPMVVLIGLMVWVSIK